MSQTGVYPIPAILLTLHEYFLANLTAQEGKPQYLNSDLSKHVLPSAKILNGFGFFFFFKPESTDSNKSQHFI